MKADKLGRKTDMTDPDRGHWTWTYSVLGELKKQTDAKGQATTHIYDKLSRLKSRATPTVSAAGPMTPPPMARASSPPSPATMPMGFASLNPPYIN